MLTAIRPKKHLPLPFRISNIPPRGSKTSLPQSLLRQFRQSFLDLRIVDRLQHKNQFTAKSPRNIGRKRGDVRVSIFPIRRGEVGRVPLA